MPSTSLSPNLATMPLSPRNASGSGTAPVRPPLMKRQSSQSSHSSRHHSHPVSPGSVGEHPAPATRHHVKPRHAKIVLPRNHSSGRNLAKLGRQAQQAGIAGGGGEESRRHVRQRSNEGPTEQQPSQQQSQFRLPGSLGDDEAGPANRAPPPMRRNMTAYQLPRNGSHTKLKKNLSHGHLSRPQSGRNLVAMATTGAHHRPPPSPGLKGRKQRPKSMDITGLEKDLHEREMELAQQRQQRHQLERRDSRKKVGFAVGSAGDGSDDEDVPEMEGSGLQEDEWTDQSASASPYSTRQNTADNSRRPSLAEKHPLGNAEWPRQRAVSKQQQDEDDDDEDDDDDDDDENEDEEENDDEEDDDDDDDDDGDEDEESDETESEEPPSPRSKSSREEQHQIKAQQPDVLTAQPARASTTRNTGVETRDHANPTTRRLLNRSQQLPAPALVSNISALDATHTENGSPSISLQSSRSNLAESAGDPDQDELVSCFVPSTSHPSLGSGMNTTINTPRQSGFHTPEEDSSLSTHRRNHTVTSFPVGPVSPGSTVSGSSSSAVPALGRSRTELRMLQEKALADIESTLERHPTIPAHFYDRRNESLKPYLKVHAADLDPSNGPIASASLNMGPEIFQGRFRAVNTELRVVQKFRNPLGDAVTRLRACKAIKSHAGSTNNTSNPRGGPASMAAGPLPTSKSTTSLPARQLAAAVGGSSSAAAATNGDSKSASPPTSLGGPLARGAAGAQSAVQLDRAAAAAAQRVGSDRGKARREVSFARAPAPMVGGEVGAMTADAIARQLWMEI